MEEPIVYMKQANEQGAYIDKDGKRFDILTCRHTESKEQVQVGTKIETDEQGNEIEVPVYEMQVVINKGWDNFGSLEEAEQAYGLTLMTEEEIASWKEPKEQEEIVEEDTETEDEQEVKVEEEQVI